MRCLVHLGLIALMFFLLSLVCIRELLLVPPSNVFFILAGVVSGALGWYCRDQEKADVIPGGLFTVTH
jgi:hypothetical protein